MVIYRNCLNIFSFSFQLFAIIFDFVKASLHSHMLIHTFQINQTEPPNCVWLSLWLLFSTHVLLIFGFFMFVSQILLSSLIGWPLLSIIFWKSPVIQNALSEKKTPENPCPFRAFNRVNTTTTTTTTKVKSSLFLLYIFLSLWLLSF